MRGIQIARYVWRVFYVDGESHSEMWNLRGEVHKVDDGEWRVCRAVFDGAYLAKEPTLEPVTGVRFRTLAQAMEALA
jgi:hypothetical protein